MRYLSFERSEGTDGICTIDAMASTDASQHGHALAEAQAVLDWAWRQYPHRHGAIDDGHDWDHDLQVHDEAGGWCVVTLTISGVAPVIDALLAHFAPT